MEVTQEAQSTVDETLQRVLNEQGAPAPSPRRRPSRKKTEDPQEETHPDQQAPKEAPLLPGAVNPADFAGCKVVLKHVLQTVVEIQDAEGDSVREFEAEPIRIRKTTAEHFLTALAMREQLRDKVEDELQSQKRMARKTTAAARPKAKKAPPGKQTRRR